MEPPNIHLSLITCASEFVAFLDEIRLKEIPSAVPTSTKPGKGLLRVVAGSVEILCPNSGCQDRICPSDPAAAF